MARVHGGAVSEAMLYVSAWLLDCRDGGEPEEREIAALGQVRNILDDDRRALHECENLEAQIDVLRPRARRVLDERAVYPDDVRAMLTEAGVRSAPDQNALEDFAHECTFRAIQFRNIEVWNLNKPEAQSLERQASNAVAALRRVLPRIIDNKAADPRVVEYRTVLAALGPNVNFSRRRIKLTWHTAARALAGLYTLHINSASGWSAHGAGCKFLSLSLLRIGVKKTEGSLAAIEKALDPRRHSKPDVFLGWLPYRSFPGLFDRPPPRVSMAAVENAEADI